MLISQPVRSCFHLLPQPIFGEHGHRASLLEDKGEEARAPTEERGCLQATGCIWDKRWQEMDPRGGCPTASMRLGVWGAVSEKSHPWVLWPPLESKHSFYNHFSAPLFPGSMT